MGLKSLRRASGLTQHEAADIFGLKRRTYQNYENGITSPDMPTAAKLARHFDCTIGELFDLQEGSREALKEQESQLLSYFRLADDAGQKAILAVTRELSELFRK